MNVLLSNLTRRSFLATLSGIAALGALPGRALAQQTMPGRAIPSSGEMLPVIGFGSTKAVRRILDQGPEEIAGVLRTLLAHDGTVVDTAPRPPDLDTAFGKLLQRPEFMDELFVTAKINAMGKDAGIEQFRQTQRLFGRQTLDLVQIESMSDYQTHWPSLRGWKDSGEARYIGVTVANEDLYDTLESFIRKERPDFIQVNYSPVERDSEAVLLPLARERGIAVMVNGPFMGGEYFGLVRGHTLPEWTADFDCHTWAQFSLKYILANPAITCVLTETTNPGHMAENIQAAFGALPEAATRERMRQLADTLV